MLLDHRLVSIIFRLINFAIFIGGSAYLFKRHMLGEVQDQIADQQSLEAVAENQKQLLINKQEEIELSLAEQDAFGHKLQKKIVAWEQGSKRSQHFLDEQKQVLRVELGRKRTLQANHYDFMQTQRAVLKPTLDGVRQQLIQVYQNQHEGKLYNQKLIKHMEKDML